MLFGALTFLATFTFLTTFAPVAEVLDSVIEVSSQLVSTVTVCKTTQGCAGQRSQRKSDDNFSIVHNFLFLELRKMNI